MVNMKRVSANAEKLGASFAERVGTLSPLHPSYYGYVDSQQPIDDTKGEFITRYLSKLDKVEKRSERTFAAAAATAALDESVLQLARRGRKSVPCQRISDSLDSSATKARNRCESKSYLAHSIPCPVARKSRKSVGNVAPYAKVTKETDSHAPVM